LAFNFIRRFLRFVPSILIFSCRSLFVIGAELDLVPAFFDATAT